MSTQKRNSTSLPVVAFGDSITLAKRQEPEARWAALVETDLRQRAGESTVRVVNAGVGGNTSREGLARIDADVLAHAPDLVPV